MDVISCAGSDFAFGTRQPPAPGVDFPQVIESQQQAGAFYTVYDVSTSTVDVIRILTEAFNNASRSQNFTVPIYMDDVPEGVEEFSLTLTLLADPTLPPRSVNVTPAVATVRIRDFSSKFIKWLYTTDCNI